MMENAQMIQGDEALYVKFYPGKKPNQAKSDSEGRPIFDDVPCIQIMSPGNKNSMVDRPVREADKQRFPKQWTAYEQGEGEFTSGTPLDSWPQITTAQVAELKYFNVHSVEQLAAMSDTNAQNFMGVIALRKKAKDYLERAAEDAPMVRLQAELDERDARIQVLEDNVAVLMSKIDEEDEDG